MRPPARCQPAASLLLDTSLLRPGMRLAVGLSGGADSVALLRALAERRGELGLVLHAAHLHHGLRGAEADADLEFARDLAARLGLPFHEAHVDTAAEARANPAAGKTSETLEEAARRLRYAWFRELVASNEVDAVATAHTLDDQAETVLAKFLRGAWTEGLAGISPQLEGTGHGLDLEPAEGLVVRPLLGVRRAEIEAYLGAIGQHWREDSSNRQLSFTRNRIRHELLPLLEGWNPRLREHLAQMAELARDEEAWWQTELARLAPQLLLRGRPVRGGGRAAGECIALDVTRLRALAPALQRRLLRHASKELGAAPDFSATEELRALALEGRAGEKRELGGGLRAERTPREVRLTVELVATAGQPAAAPEYSVAVPGEIEAPAFGLRLRIETSSGFRESNTQSEGSGVRVVEGLVLGPASEARDPGLGDSGPGRSGSGSSGPGSSGARCFARLRNWRAGDRVRLRHSSGLRKVKEVLERKRVTGSERTIWPVLEWDGRIVWMKGVALEQEPGIAVVVEFVDGEGAMPS